MTRGILDEDRRPRSDEARKSDLVDISAKLIAETDRAFHIDDGGRQVWLPKSQVERDGDTYTMPEWLAVERKLI